MKLLPLLIVVLLVGCSSATESTNTHLLSEPAPATITVSLSLYVVHVSDGAGAVPSVRSEANLEEIAANMAEIWSQAGINFDPVNVATIEVPSAALADLDHLDSDTFLRLAGREFDVPNPGLINGFYIAAAGGVNGFAPARTRTFFVVDEPTVHDERVSSHEVGHILGLHHDLEDVENLLFSGTNGTVLTGEQQMVARYSARGVVAGAR